ncbi:enoyl-CoA hydratase/isomerase family protein [Pleomorphovibrio marinus]|uniref:enoyl-CoA hydratase/isomerase family protein n=1 Tax=Pleomorphovibrio marinus TaxID=2164132 RepID=UPI000E0A232A|nr:enoyl-CoA hydratase-related protein [Pleomorphovibrio marinus]
MKTSPIVTEIDNRVGHLVLNRPDKRNALNPEMIERMKHALKGFVDNENVRVILIRSEGKVFCSGADLMHLQKLKDYSYEENLEDSLALKALFDTIHRSSKVIVAAVQGHALAGGCGLVNVCDFAFSVPEAKFGFTEVSIGFVPAIVAPYVNEKIGHGKARQLLLSGRIIEAKEALEIGMLSGIVQANSLQEHAQSFCVQLAKTNSPQALAQTKELLADLVGLGLYESLEKAAQVNARARNTVDCQQGIAAFLKKEKKEW